MNLKHFIPIPTLTKFPLLSSNNNHSFGRADSYMDERYKYIGKLATKINTRIIPYKLGSKVKLATIIPIDPKIINVVFFVIIILYIYIYIMPEKLFIIIYNYWIF